MKKKTPKTKAKKTIKFLHLKCPECNHVTNYETSYLYQRMNIKESVTVEPPIEILRDYLAGVGYSDYQRVLQQLKVGDKLDLTWERKNKFDPNAIRVDYKGTKLGYIAKKDNQKVHQYREGGAKVTCELTAINHGNPSHTLLCVSVKVSTERSSQSITSGDQKISG